MPNGALSTAAKKGVPHAAWLSYIGGFERKNGGVSPAVGKVLAVLIRSVADRGAQEVGATFDVVPGRVGVRVAVLEQRRLLVPDVVHATVELDMIAHVPFCADVRVHDRRDLCSLDHGVDVLPAPRESPVADRITGRC